MLIRFARMSPVLVVLAALILSSATTSPARADDPISPVNCSETPRHPTCRVEVQRPGRDPDGRSVDGSGSGSGSGTDSNAGGDDGPCEWVRVSDDPPPPGVSGPGGWYSQRCSGDGWASGTRPQWVPDDAVAADPAVVARSAVATLRLPSPTIRLSPSPPAPQLVNVPTWLWLEQGSWAARSATASVPGLAVTATAEPVRVRWSTGDGTEVTCTGPGTRWKPGMDPAASSPTCGHTYRRPSVGRPGGVFAVRATVMWQVSWVGGGQAGTVPALSTTSAAQIAVREAPAVNNGVRG
jgi:hypothetical protein